jgi:hypothetical protein
MAARVADDSHLMRLHATGSRPWESTGEALGIAGFAFPA